MSRYRLSMPVPHIIFGIFSRLLCPRLSLHAFFDMPTQRELEEVACADGVIPLFTSDWIRETAIGNFIFEMVQNDRLTLQDLRVLVESPSVSGAHWQIVACAFNLKPLMDEYQLPIFSIPRTFLPPSFHKRVMHDSINWLDAYGDNVLHDGSTPARMRLIDAVYSTNIFLFYAFTLSFSGSSLCAPYIKAS